MGWGVCVHIPHTNTYGTGICGLLDVDNPHNKQLNRKDMYRFKEVLMGLRKQGDRAPGAAGY